MNEPTPGAKAQSRHRKGLVARLEQLDAKINALLLVIQTNGVVLPDTTIAELKRAFSKADRR